MFRSNKQPIKRPNCELKYSRINFLSFLCFNLTLLNCTQAFSFSSPVNIKNDPVHLSAYSFRLSTIGERTRPNKYTIRSRIHASLQEHNDNDTGNKQETLDIEKQFTLSTLVLKETESRLNQLGYETQVDFLSSENEYTVQNMRSSDEKANRRIFLASVLLTAGLAIGGPAVEAKQLQWETSPVNKRSGVTVFDAEKSGYNIQFITYLSRFLLSFDAECQGWWYARAKDIPRMASSDEVDNIRLKQFAAFSASVEIGLQEYQLPDGPQRLMTSLLERYCPTPAEIKNSRILQNLPPLSQQAEDRQQTEVKEARRQIALLFGLMKSNQPVEDLTKLLASIDNGSITSVDIQNGGSGYAPGYGSPYVTFPPPEAGEGYERATGIAVLKPNGKILRLDLVDSGSGYTKPPIVTVSSPLAAKNGIDPRARTAMGKAVIVRDGSNKGKMMRIDLVDSGYGYTPDEHVKIEISPPDIPAKDGGRHASAVAVKELEVRQINITNGGSGYAVEKPIEVYVEPPPFTARVDLNNKLLAKIIEPDRPYPTTTLQSKTPGDDSSPLTARIMKASRMGEGGGCYGRACYDEAVVATAYAVAEKDSYASFRMDEAPLIGQENIVSMTPKNDTSTRKISGAGSGQDRPPLAFSTSSNSSSSQLLQLLPSGIGLEYDENLKIYILAEETGVEETKAYFKAPSSLKPIDPEFGPRGRSPIERQKVLDLNLFLRFIASGALCSSTVHLLLTPLDVVKTKIQTDPKKYPNVISAFKTMSEENDSILSFFAGWVPTFFGYFVLGGISFSVIEFLRRYFTEQAGNSAASLEIPIILASSTISAILGSFVLAPFEAVRVRSVAQPDYAPNTLGVMNRMIQDEGLSTLFSAVPVFISKEIPFTIAKFLVFDLSTNWMYEHFPTAKEDIQLSLVVSLIGGTLGGISAAIVSNPGDATISEMKKAKSGVGPIKTAKKLIDEGGSKALMRGVDVRMVFYSLIVSLQFFVYDNIRFALNIGSDDLTLYLNVLGGALQDSGGPV